VEDNLCLGQESWDISRKLFKEELERGFSLAVSLHLVSIVLCAIVLVIA